MGFRDTLKKTFTKKPSDASDNKPLRRKDIEYYKPHEIPKSKYRGKVDKLHQAQLDAYSLEGAFGSARRRASNALSGTFSPGHRSTATSRAASRAASAANSRRPSYARARSHLSTTANSVADSDSDSDENPETEAEAEANSTKSSTGSQDSSPSLIPDDTDMDSPLSSNGISRSITAADNSRNDLTTSLSLERTVTAKPAKVKEPQYENHFTAEELEHAMAQASMRGRRGTVLGPVVVAA